MHMEVSGQMQEALGKHFSSLSLCIQDASILPGARSGLFHIRSDMTYGLVISAMLGCDMTSYT